MESPLDNNNQYSFIPQGYEHNILDELEKIVKEEIEKLAEKENLNK